MSRPNSVSPRPPGCGPPSGGPSTASAASSSSCPGSGRAKGLKDIRIDEEVKIAVNIALERFRYGDQRGGGGVLCLLAVARSRYT
ncbi:UNVERIFIED_CONTAM: 3'-5' RNA helicase ythdc2 [Gekko kuhli]